MTPTLALEVTEVSSDSSARPADHPLTDKYKLALHQLPACAGNCWFKLLQLIKWPMICGDQQRVAQVLVIEAQAVTLRQIAVTLMHYAYSTDCRHRQNRC